MIRKIGALRHVSLFCGREVNFERPRFELGITRFGEVGFRQPSDLDTVSEKIQALYRGI